MIVLILHEKKVFEDSRLNFGEILFDGFLWINKARFNSVASLTEHANDATFSYAVESLLVRVVSSKKILSGSRFSLS